VAGVVAGVVLLAACRSSSSPVLTEGRVPSPYPGRLDVPLADAESTSWRAQTGSASKALECDTAPLIGERGYFGPNLATVDRSAEAVLVRLLRESATTLPGKGYRVEREAQHRVLFSYDVSERTKVAVVAVDGVRDSTGHQGWALEAWAMCDPADLPEAVSASLGYQVWQDAAGTRVPTTTVRSFNGGAHCDWADVTFLEHGNRSYLRDPHRKLADYLRTTYEPHATLPRDAKDTGFRRDGRELWEEPSGRAAYLVTSDDVERWPAAKQPIGCA
jgi:hypothetical protein